MTTPDKVRHYYESSNDELARRYIKDERFLSADYCKAALDHRYGLYPFIGEFVDFGAWAGRRVLEVGCGQGADLSQFALAGAETHGCDLTRKHCDISRAFVRTSGGRAPVLQAAPRALPYPANPLVLADPFGVLLLLDDLDAALAEIYRVLK